MPALPSNLRALRLFLGLTQKQMGALVPTSVHSLLSVELGRMALSSKMALKIARATGISLEWLTGGPGPMLNDRGELYTKQDFDDSRNRDQTMEFYLSVEEMEILVAADLLLRVHKEVRARAFHAFPQFHKDLNHVIKDFIKDQAKKIPQLGELKARIEQENKARNQRQERPRSYLFPASTEPFKRIRRKANEAATAFSDWEKRTASRS
jgi:transcriptional regulator with XRE-family HTH domain